MSVIPLALILWANRYSRRAAASRSGLLGVEAGGATSGARGSSAGNNGAVARGLGGTGRLGRRLGFGGAVWGVSMASVVAGINAFTVTPAVFLPGQEVTVAWNVAAGDEITITPEVGPLAAATGSVRVTPGASTTWVLTNKTSGTTAEARAQTPAPTSLRHRWSFNEAAGTVVTDSIGGRDGTIRGPGFLRIAAPAGGANPGQVSLAGGPSGTAAYIDLPNSLLSPLREATLEGWVTINGSQSNARIFDFGTGTGGELTEPGGASTATEYLAVFSQIASSQASKRMIFRDNGSESRLDISDPATAGAQFHFAVVYDAEGNNGATPQLRYFKNGLPLGSVNTSLPLTTLTDVNNWLGRANTTSHNNLNGSYNEFRVWEGALTAQALADTTAAGPETVPQIPRIDSFSHFPGTTTSIYSGTSLRLGWVVASPPEAGPLNLTLSGGVGAVTSSSGFVTVTPQQTTTYQLQATNTAGTRTASITLTVAPSAPQAQPLDVTVPYQTATPVTLAATDLNTPAANLVFSIVDPPAHGTVTGTGPTRTYSPANNFSGTDRMTYIASDGTTDSAPATVTFTVQPAPLPPTAVSLSEATLAPTLQQGSFAGRLQTTDGNPDDQFTYSLVAGAGDAHNPLFQIVGHQLLATRSLSDLAGQRLTLRVRVTDRAGLSFEQIVERSVESQPLEVRINEINYNPARNTQLAEYIELHNPLPTAVTLDGWRLVRGVEFVFPVGTTLASGGYLVVAEDPATIDALFGVAALGPWTGGLSSDGEEIELRNADGDTVDKVTYGVTAPWPVPPNGDGPSLELIHPLADNDTGGSWRASTATPAAVSYVAAGSPGWRFRRGVSEASSPIGAWRATDFTEVIDPVDTKKNWEEADLPIGLFKRNNNSPVATLPEAGVTLKKQLPDMATFSGSTFNAAYRSVFLRKTFTVSGDIPRALLLRVMHNDAAIVWINGVEVVRFGFPPGAPADPAFNTTAIYERGNDPWSELVLTRAGTLLKPGANVLALQGWSKAPQIRTEQDDPGTYNQWDFCLDASLGTPLEATGTPGAQNSVWSLTSPPVVRAINHAPTSPKSWQSITVTAKIADAQGIGPVQVHYQVCPAGSFIPSTLPLTNSQIVANPRRPLPPNPAFEDAANWLSTPMVDDGSLPSDTAGDGVFTAIIPAQPHRALVRYRITATDLTGASLRVPAENDPRKNFALFVYDTLPVYTKGTTIIPPDTLSTLPVYHWLTRATDYAALLAYTSTNQFANNADLNNLLARHYENIEGALVVGDQVIDHTLVRLRGGNSRYMGNGKRHMRFKFPDGTPFQATDEAGRPYARPWEEMLFNKLFGNKGYYDWGLVYEVGAKLWAQQGIPMPESHHLHFRVVRHANENDATNGDFWGLYQALELPEGKNFLDARNLPQGNFYKLTDWQQNGEMDQRYQAPGAPEFAEDFDNIRYNVHQTTPQSELERYLDMPLWYRYNAVQEAIRHYDLFVEPTGRHRVKNLIWYFQPKEGTNGLGQLIYMPYDWDASFGPNWNSGWDLVHNSLYNRFIINDSPTWKLPLIDRSPMKIDHRNAIRELRDLIWYRDPATGRGPLDDMIDDALAPLASFWPADRLRWPTTGAQGDHVGGAPFKAQDMKNFAFSGWTDPFNGDPTVPAGGRAAHLDTIADGPDNGLLPARPVITYAGAAGYPVDGLVFTASAFSDPQGPGTAGAIQWRVGEITDPTAPAHDPAADRIYEATAVWDSGALPATATSQAVPPVALRSGHTYRARARYRDTTGRWSHWSEPLQLTTTSSNYTAILQSHLMVTEIMYHPANPSPTETAAGFVEGDFEYIELQNISPALTLDLRNVRLTKGVDYDFSSGRLTSLAPGQRIVIVKNEAAFALRYGNSIQTTGAWDAADNLSNAGETVKVSFGAGDAIQEFRYSDLAPWPVQADKGGWSLVLRTPSSQPDHTLPTNWRASLDNNGNPGTSDGQTYDAWAAAYALTDPLGDTDADGLSAVLEYAFGGTPQTPDQSRLPVMSLTSHTVNGVPANYLTLTMQRLVTADEATAVPEWSPSLTAQEWSRDGVLVSSSIDRSTLLLTEVWRAATPVTDGSPLFGRVRVTVP